MKRTSFFSLLLLGSVLAAAGAAPDLRTASPSPVATSSAPVMLPSFPNAPADARITPEGWFAVEKKSEQSRLSGRPSHVFIIPIKGNLSKDTFETVNRSVKQAAESHADLIVFDMDTWGGELLPSLDIARLIHAISEDIYTVCYIRTKAISGGTMIALSCNEIVMTPTGMFGDLSIVSAVGTLTPIEREKVETVLRSQLRESARTNGYSASLSQAMVSASTEVWLIRHKQTAQLQYVLAEEWRGRVDAPTGATTMPTDSAAQWKLLEVVKPADRVLTLNAQEATAFGLVSKVIDQSGTDSYSALMQAFHAEGRPTVLGNVAGPATSSAPATLPVFPDAPPGAKITAQGWFAPVGDLQKPPAPAHPSRVFVIPVMESITQKTWDVFQRKIQRCRQSGADMIILDMDTLGGDLFAGLDINRFIKVNLKDIYTICYVRTRAISAGALIGMACHEIVMVPESVMGDCQVIETAAGMPDQEREKLETEVRTEFRQSAERNGYSEAVSMGMVTFNNEVWLVQNKRTSELQYVLAEEWAGRVDVPPGVTSMPSNTAASWQLVQVIKPKGRLLTMKANEAVRFGFVNKVVNAPANDPYGPLLALYHASGQPTVLEDTWSGKIVEFLTSPVLTGILMLVGTLAIYLEFQAPGHIVPGVIGGLCFAVVFGSRFLIGMSDWWPIALFIVGIGLILLEVLVFTGHMVWAITGILMCFAALGALFLPNSPGRLPAMPSTPLDWTVFTNGLLSIAVAFVLGMISMIVATSYLRKLPIAGKLVLPELPLSDKPPVMSTSPLLRLKAGDQGVVHSMCRPVGKVRFGNDIVDAASEGEVLTAGQKVRVLRNDGNRIIIEKIS